VNKSAFLPVATVFAAIALSGCGGAPGSTSTITTPTTPITPKWIASWGDSPVGTTGAGSEQTFREIVKPTVGSRGTVRLHFSNYFGTTPVTLGAVHIAVQSSGAAVSSTDTAVTFSGSGSATIPAGGFLTSDNISYTWKYGDVLAITEYVSGTWTGLTYHNQAGSNVTSYATAVAAGNQTADTAGSSFTTKIYNTFLLDRVDVYGSYTETIAAIGGSTTDGLFSGLDAHMTYPEQLAAALHTEGRDDVGIANEGISGDQLLGTGVTAGNQRFARDVLALPGVTAVINYLGANDLRDACVTAPALIAGQQALAAQAHTAGIKIYLGITAPSTYCGAQNPSGFGTRFAQGTGEEAQRFLFVAWEKSTGSTIVSGTTESAPQFDALIDFNAPLADPSNISYMLPALDSGDDIHPNATGYGLMAAAVPLTLF
jgi:lysophospholipase L1-like esterase